MVVINASAKAKELELQGNALKQNPDVATIKFIERIREQKLHAIKS